MVTAVAVKKSTMACTDDRYSIHRPQGQEICQRSIYSYQQKSFWSAWRLAIVTHRLLDEHDDELSQRSGSGSSRRGITMEDDDGESCPASDASLLYELEHLRAQLGRHVSTKARLEVGLSECVAQRRKLESELAAAVMKEEVAVRNFQELRSDTSGRQSKLEAALSDASRGRSLAETRLEKATKSRLDLERQLAECLKTNASLEAECSRLQQELTQTSANLKKCENDLEELRETTDVTYRQLRGKYERAKSKITELTKKLQEETRENEAIRLQNSNLESKLTDVENYMKTDGGKELLAMEEKLATLTLKFSEVSSERDELEVQLSTLRTRNLQNLAEKMSPLKNGTRRTSSLV